ncbi:PRC-barrel domain-containing protein [Tateyamaria omphalii]|uniref:PRC-barrel domain-containing protein n=1 Tax=Tateyamaria omphalii TaxID=299262 RepID=UPI001C99F1BE|nr:PRC-barrel domain-containing protein [Tateyamaria omphalii]MBY5933444.1 PRC-barrel domain-containing protein [Tateyamaria omphalii]
MTLKSLKMSAAMAAILAAGSAYADTAAVTAKESHAADYAVKAEELAKHANELSEQAEQLAEMADELAASAEQMDMAQAEQIESTDDTIMPLTADAEAPTDPVTDTGMEDTDLAENDAVQPTTEMTVADLLGMNVVSANDEVIGEIDYVVNSLDGQAAVIGIGGFLGLGEYTVAIDVNEFEITEDEQLKLSQYTEAELEALPEFDETGVESLPDETPIDAQF